MAKKIHPIATQFFRFATAKKIKIDDKTEATPLEIALLVKRLAIIQKVKGKADIVLSDLNDTDKLLVAKLARWHPAEDEYGMLPVRITDLCRLIIGKWKPA